MIKKFFNKFANLLFIFISIIMFIGIFSFSIKNYTTPVVQTTVLYQNYTGSIIKTFKVSGQIIPSIEDEVEIKAASDIVIKDINVEKNQYMFAKDNLFKIDFENLNEYNFEKNEVYNDQISNINDSINSKIRSLCKFLNISNTNINLINSKENILIKAPVSGKITNLNIEQGKSVKNQVIGSIIDPENIKIEFYMTPNEYPLVTIGQKLLVNFSGYDGYYTATVTDIDNSQVKNSDNSAFMYKGELTMKNPGLITPGISVGTYIQQNGEAKQALYYSGKVEEVQSDDILSPMVSSYSMDITVEKLHVKNGDVVEEGQIIAEIGGKDLQNYIDDAIRDIRKDESNKQELVDKINDTYNDFIKGNNGFISISEDGQFTSNGRILISYAPSVGFVPKGATLLKYYVVSEDCEYIKLDVDNKNYYNGVQQRLNSFRWNPDAYSSYKLNYVYAASFLDHYEVFFSLPRTTKYLKPYDEVKIEMQYTDKYSFVVPKSALVAEKGIAVGNPCYIYTILKRDAFIGNHTIINDKATGYILDYDSNYVAVVFDEPERLVDVKSIVNFVDSSYEKGMRVKVE